MNRKCSRCASVLSDLEETSQVSLKRLFGRGLSIRSEPGFEVLDPDSVLNLWLLHGDCNRQILMDRIDPIVLAKNVQSATHSFIETPSGDFDRVFRTTGVATRDFAGPLGHPHKLALRFYFVQMLDEGAGVGVVVVVTGRTQSGIHPLYQPLQSVIDLW